MAIVRAFIFANCTILFLHLWTAALAGSLAPYWSAGEVAIYLLGAAISLLSAGLAVCLVVTVFVSSIPDAYQR
jgi:hypothetical protein